QYQSREQTTGGATTAGTGKAYTPQGAERAGATALQPLGSAHRVYRQSRRPHANEPGSGQPAVRTSAQHEKGITKWTIHSWLEDSTTSRCRFRTGPIRPWPWMKVTFRTRC